MNRIGPYRAEDFGEPMSAHAWRMKVGETWITYEEYKRQSGQLSPGVLARLRLAALASIIEGQV
ncbi:MAG: hypothetical protein EOP83_25635 [Verrucomicrobiaceae bacterium]|nr:MAG: hypothetical protein EOP83_25635 [Verrucomicrobiaceae bacterium]